MSEYELYHASTRKHKYIKKIGNRYFYTQQEIAAYLKEKRGQVGEFNEAVAEATGRRDVYLEANKKRKDGGTYNPSNYDKTNATLRTGKKDRSLYKLDGAVVTKHDTIQYDTPETKKRNAETRARGRKKLESMTGIKVSKLKDVRENSEKGKKALGTKLAKSLGIGHHTEVTTNGKTTAYDTSYDGKVTKSEPKKSKIGHNTEIKTGGGSKSQSKNSRIGHDTQIKTRQIKKKDTQDLGGGLSVTYDEAVIKDNKSSSKTINTTKKKKPKKQKSKARKAINKFYRNNINPGITVTYDEAKIK